MDSTRQLKSADVGVIVGRFQVHKLHLSHEHLIATVINACKRVVIFIGVPEKRGTPENPLSFEMVSNMIMTSRPGITVLPIRDVPTDNEWSLNLDNVIDAVVNPSESVMLFGSRDSFIDHYKGDHKCQELVAQTDHSGTFLRGQLVKSIVNSEDFRHGVIYGTIVNTEEN